MKRYLIVGAAAVLIGACVLLYLARDTPEKRFRKAIAEWDILDSHATMAIDDAPISVEIPLFLRWMPIPLVEMDYAGERWLVFDFSAFYCVVDTLESSHRVHDDLADEGE